MGSLLRTPQANRDLVEIWSYIAKDNLTAAENVLEGIERICDNFWIFRRWVSRASAWDNRLGVSRSAATWSSTERSRTGSKFCAFSAGHETSEQSSTTRIEAIVSAGISSRTANLAPQSQGTEAALYGDSYSNPPSSQKTDLEPFPLR